MAEEIIRIVQIDTDSAVNSLKSLQDEANSLRATLATLDEGTKEYTETVNKLAEAEENLKSVLANIDYSSMLSNVQVLKDNFTQLKTVFEGIDGSSFITIDGEAQKLVTGINEIVKSVNELKNAFNEVDGKSYVTPDKDADELVKSMQEIIAQIKALKSEDIDKLIDEIANSILDLISKSEKLKDFIPSEPKITVKGLKDEINDLRDALLNTEKGSEEYNAILQQLIDDQTKLTDAMRAGKNEASAATGSYNGLVNQLAALKKVWRETTDEASRKELGKSIKEINNKLKGMDESIGDFRRNVGNYTQSVTAAFGSMGGAAKGMIGPINGVKAAFTALSAHPIVAVLTTLAALLINGIVKGFKSSEEATNKLKNAFSGFQAIGDAITKMFQKIANVIGDVATSIVNLLDKWGLLGDKFKERQALANKEIYLQKKQRDNIKKNADLEKEAAELRAKSADASNYTAKERLDFMEQALKKEEEIAENEYLALKQEYEIIQAKNALAESSAEMKEAEAKAYAAMVQAQTAYLEKTRSTNKQVSRLRKEMARDAESAKSEMLKLEKDLIEQEYDLAVNGSAEQLALAKKKRDKELEIQQDEIKKKIKNRKEYEKAIKLSIEAYNNDIANLEADSVRKAIERENKLAERRLYAYREGTLKYYEEAKKDKVKLHSLYQQVLDLGGENLNLIDLSGFDENTQKIFKELRGKLPNEIMEIFGDLEHTTRVELENISNTITDIELKLVEQTNELVLEGTRPMSKYYQTMQGQLLDLYNGENAILQKFGESDEEFALRRAKIWKGIIESSANYNKAIINEHEVYKKTVNLNHDIIGGTLAKLQTQLEIYEFNLRHSLSGIRSNLQLESENMINFLKGKFQSEDFEDFFNLDGLMEGIKSEELKTEEGMKKATEILLAIFDGDLNYFTNNMKEGIDVTQDELESRVDGLRNFLIGLMGESGLIDESLFETYINSLTGLKDTEAEILDERMNNWESLADGIGKIMGSVSDIFDESMAQRKDMLEREGRYTEAERKMMEDEYNHTIKPMKIAEATINTINGALAAFMGWQDKGQPWGAIIGAVQAAAVTAAGVAQIQKIINTNPYSGGNSNLGGSTMMATVTPVMSDYQPQMTGSVTGQQETEELVNNIITKADFYVRVSDIDDAQEKGRVRVEESSY